MDMLYSYVHFTQGTFLLGLLGWREKRGFVSSLSQSPTGQPLVLRKKKFYFYLFRHF
jgi:hypothetical protein